MKRKPKRDRKPDLFPKPPPVITIQPPLPDLLDVPPHIRHFKGRGRRRQGRSPSAPPGKPPPDNAPLEGQLPLPQKGTLP